MIYEVAQLCASIPSADKFKKQVVDGLMLPQKRLFPKYFYDERGSELFERITVLPEYYLTRTENAILHENIGELVELLGNHVTLIEFGSGASTKTRLLLDEMADPCAYVPIDISLEFLRESAQALSRRYPGLPILPVWMDYTHSLTPLRYLLADHARRVAFFPGSTIGNMEPQEMRLFLKDCRHLLGQGGRLLLGIDLVKSPEVLERAYNDSQGVTAEFNLNVLRRIRDELRVDLDLEQFRHEARYNSNHRRIEMHLISCLDQEWEIDGRCVGFKKEESIVTEHSYKFDLEDLERRMEEQGLSVVRCWTDSARQFAVALLEVLY